MNVGASLSSIRFPNCFRCFCFPKPLISLVSSSSSMSQFCVNNSSVTTASVATDASSATDAVAMESVKSKQQHPWLIVGLGNPGKKYVGTRHNVGFEMVDAIAEAEGISMSSVSFKALFGKGLIGEVPVLLAKPQTFMNASGESVGAIASYYKIPLKQVLVIFDDLDLPFAKLRLLPKGGHGGHNGMRSVIKYFKGSLDFPRLRIGIGRPPGKMDPINFVIRPFTKQEREELNFTFQHGVEAVRILLLEGFNKSATFVNSAKTLEQIG
ncbi:Peptidyl-tRNA hydrolase chloroplastic [Quillaja saponaria]|uniref:peptidyl-tRNA hydrolase n=1 Tax=Quillaja saponaria TaxID=32244 RepID=A0AAD7VK33_QUISA|nr:Peptidyl-tRNA hydrolase chloroplastic [Quillaja saponaria]KAJ7978430.1 Peptidyl-tRNA hydrolase chloroplastic [Quillaja saponaria]